MLHRGVGGELFVGDFTLTAGMATSAEFSMYVFPEREYYETSVQLYDPNNADVQLTYSHLDQFEGKFHYLIDNQQVRLRGIRILSSALTFRRVLHSAVAFTFLSRN